MLRPNFFRPYGALCRHLPTHGLRRGLKSLALSGFTKMNSIGLCLGLCRDAAASQPGDPPAFSRRLCDRIPSLPSEAA